MDFSAAGYISLILTIGVLAFAIVLGIGIYYRMADPHFWNILLPSVVLCSFAAFILYPSISGDFDFFMFVVGIGVGGVGLRYFVELFKDSPKETKDTNPAPATQTEPVNLRLPTYEEELTQYQSDLKAYERYKSAILEKEKTQILRQQVWNDLYYCYRDGVVILPREGYYVEARDMETFINIQANRRNRE